MIKRLEKIGAKKLLEIDRGTAFMQKSNAVVKVDTAENWAKARNYVPDNFTIIVYTYESGSPKVKIGDGVTAVNGLPFLNNKEVEDDTLVL